MTTTDSGGAFRLEGLPLTQVIIQTHYMCYIASRIPIDARIGHRARIGVLVMGCILESNGAGDKS